MSAASRLAAALVVAWSARALAGDGGYLHRLAAEAHARLDAAARAHAPKIVPPRPVAVRWHAQQIGSRDLGAPLVALAAADLDGDGKAELYAVTTREVVALSATPRLHELGRVAFGGDPAVPQPRDPVGTAVVEGGAVIASVSAWARGLRVSLQAGALRGDGGEPGFELCPGEHAELAPGRNYFGDGAGAYYAVACADLVDAAGAPLHVRAQLSTADRLQLTVGSATRELKNVGVAFALADVDRDGTPELIFAGAGAPGDPDRVEVLSLGTDKKPKLDKKFTAEGVAGIAVGDLDGDGTPDAIAAVRLFGSTVVDFWRLD